MGMDSSWAEAQTRQEQLDNGTILIYRFTPLDSKVSICIDVQKRDALVKGIRKTPVLLISPV